MRKKVTGKAPIVTAKVSGKFKLTKVQEGKNKAELTVLDSSKGIPVYITRQLKTSDMTVYKTDAARRLQSKTGISKAAIKKLGL